MIITLAWPTIIEEAIHTGMQYVDNAMVGKLGANASAAVGLTISVGWVMVGTFTALGAGVLSCVAKSLGAGDRERARSACIQAILLTLLAGGVIGLVAMGISPFVPAWLGAEPEIRRDASIYFFLISIPMVMRAATSICGAAIRATGDTKTPMRVSLVTIALKVVLNLLLIYGPRSIALFGCSLRVPGLGLGVAGAGIASAVCFALNGVLMMRALVKTPLVSSQRVRIRFDKDVMVSCVRVGLPIAAQRSIIHIGHVIFTALVARLGTIAVATHSIALTAEEAFYVPGYGMQAASSTLAGRAAGKMDAKELQKTSLLVAVLAALAMTLMSALLYAFAVPVMGVFTPVSVVIEGGAGLLRIVALSEPLFAVSIIMEGVFNGVGEVKTPFLVSVCSMWGIRILCTYLCVVWFGLGLTSVWICMVADNVVRCILLTVRFFTKNWNDYIKKQRSPTAGV